MCAVLDWLVQPKPRWLGGNGWLLDGPEEVLQGRVRDRRKQNTNKMACQCDDLQYPGLELRCRVP